MKLPVPVVKAVVRGLVKPVLGPPVPLVVQRAYLQALSAPLLPAGTTVERTVLGGRPAERVTGAGADGRGSVLLLHGGAFITGSPRSHRVVAAHLAAAASVPVHVLDYRLSPEHPYPAPVDDAIAAYDQLAADGPVAVFGDSAGGCLALLLARTRTPVALALVSPLTDLTRGLSGAWTGEDILVRTSWAREGCEAFAGGADLRSLSPRFDDLSGLPPTLVHVSEHERLRPEGEELVARAREVGVDVELVELPGLWHDVHLFAHLLDEAAQATASIGRWLGARLR